MFLSISYGIHTMSICVGHMFNQFTCILRLEGRSILYPLLFVFFLQKGLTATLIAACKGHLTVLETLVEQYGGNVLHRMKVTCVVTGVLMNSCYSPSCNLLPCACVHKR